ncbi:MAG: hypothetical protein H7Z75_20155 [Ferruginibacter sp.]|nr:hypothetical protein [Cytophagales bacterium]
MGKTWNLRIGVHNREGLVIYDARYEDQKCVKSRIKDIPQGVDNTLRDKIRPSSFKFAPAG